MRTLTANAEAKLTQNTGTEWLVVLEVEWVDGGSVYYSDQEFAGTEPRVISMGGFDTSMTLQGSSDTQELSIVLDDTDGELREIYKDIDVHKRPARVYLVEKSLTLADKIIVFKGELVTPIQWDEQQRTFSFNVLSKLDSVQVGFSMEEGDFPNIPDEALGKAWPLAFGQVCHLPAVKVRAPRRGYLLGEGVGIHDFTLDTRICQAVKIQCPSQSTGCQVSYTQGPNNTWGGQSVATHGPDLECVNRRFGEICRLKDLRDQQEAYEYNTLNIYNGVNFPQGEKVTIVIDGGKFTGIFSGNLFSVISREHPELATFNEQKCRNIPNFGYGQRAAYIEYQGVVGSGSTPQGGWRIQDYGTGGGKSVVWSPTGNSIRYVAQQDEAGAFRSCEEALTGTATGMIGGPKDSWEYYDSLEESSFFFAPPGSEVYLEGEDEILYIVSLLPGTVDGVAAYRTASNGFRYLTAVPESNYTVYETDYDGYQVVEVELSKQLSLLNDQWEDDIYVSFTSSVGPNPCDIIEWLVDKYTNLTVDATSFASVKAKLTKYPTNFYLTTRPDVYNVINDIAYQSRCAVYIRNDVVYIRYLSEEPSSERTISESDILSGSFTEFLSETEDVYTTHNITWKKGGAAVRDDLEAERKLILKYNVTKYGTVEDEWDYYCLNLYDLVLKTGTFWLIRKANSWRKARFRLPFKHLDLDVGDCITLDVERFSAPVKVVIESMQLNPDEYTIDVECWTPIRSGEDEAYFWAWPAAQPCASVWPLAGDNNGGGGYNFSVTPPVGSILLGGSRRDDQLIISSGEKNPSDLCDTTPTVICELSDYFNFGEIEPAILAKQIAQSAARQSYETTMTGGGGNAGGGGGDQSNDQEDGCCTVPFGCCYCVIVIYHTSVSQIYDNPPGCRCGPGGPSCGPGPSWSVCHVFGAPWAAEIYRAQMESKKKDLTDPTWTCGETQVVVVNPVGACAHKGVVAGECPPVAGNTTPPDSDQANGGEAGAPFGTTGNEPY
jgi:hypothetical protein